MDKTILNEFLTNFRYINGHVVKWWQISDDTIIVEDDDGWYHKYDSILKTDKCSNNILKLVTFSISNETCWTKSFSNGIYKAVLKSGYKQDILSWDSKVSTGSISSYINGERIPSIYILLRLAKTTGCGLKDIMNILCINRECENENVKFLFIDDKEEWAFEFSVRLNRFIRHKKISRKTLAEYINITEACISKYLSGKTIPSAYTAFCIIRELNLSVEEIKELLCIE